MLNLSRFNIQVRLIHTCNFSQIFFLGLSFSSGEHCSAPSNVILSPTWLPSGAFRGSTDRSGSELYKKHISRLEMCCKLHTNYALRMIACLSVYRSLALPGIACPIYFITMNEMVIRSQLCTHYLKNKLWQFYDLERGSRFSQSVFEYYWSEL